MIWRGYNDYTYYTCMRCQQKYPMEMMSWDAGLLVCIPRCKDRDVNGSFEFEMARQCSIDRKELTPDPKLVSPTDVLFQIEHVSARAGEGLF